MVAEDGHITTTAPSYSKPSSPNSPRSRPTPGLQPNTTRSTTSCSATRSTRICSDSRASCWPGCSMRCRWSVGSWMIRKWAIAEAD